jgi:hypothetical protein
MISNKKIIFPLHLFYVELSPVLDARPMISLFKKIIVANSKEVKTGFNLASIV